MKSIPIKGHTRRIGAPVNWDHSEKGICHTIEVLDEGGWMMSAWLPTPKELEQLNAGYPIILSIGGNRHPVVSLVIGGFDDGENNS